jgi:N-acetylneuraminate lyase
MKLGLRGLIAAPFTPLTEDGSLDLPGIDRLCEHLLRLGCSGAFVCGTTGEGVSLTVAERMAVAARWIASAPDGFPVLIHCGALSLPDARALAHHAHRIGAQGVSVTPPCFLKPATEDDVLDWLAAVANACPGLPVTYYHIPSLTGVAVRMLPLIARALERVPNFGGIKFTHEDLHDYGRCVAAYGDALDLAFGRDESLLPALSVGAVVAVGSTYNVAAPLYLRLMDAFARGDITGANALQEQSRAMIDICIRHRAQPAMKALLGLQNVPCGPCRLPLRTLSAAETESLRADLAALPIGDALLTGWR